MDMIVSQGFQLELQNKFAVLENLMDDRDKAWDLRYILFPFPFLLIIDFGMREDEEEGFGINFGKKSASEESYE